MLEPLLIVSDFRLIFHGNLFPSKLSWHGIGSVHDKFLKHYSSTVDSAKLNVYLSLLDHLFVLITEVATQPNFHILDFADHASSILLYPLLQQFHCVN